MSLKLIYQYSIYCCLYEMFYVSHVATKMSKPTVDSQKVKRRESKCNVIQNFQFTVLTVLQNS